ncbi:MAG TPA: hypothetical protein VHZ55_00575 [Bryobacteraceae bacterium]|jgi:hypothetical protein|nr:hypothetical protein [Bryobacteraceae bacterium]
MVVLSINVPVEFSFFVYHALLARLTFKQLARRCPRGASDLFVKMNPLCMEPCAPLLPSKTLVITLGLTLSSVVDGFFPNLIPLNTGPTPSPRAIPDSFDPIRHTLATWPAQRD